MLRLARTLALLTCMGALAAPASATDFFDDLFRGSGRRDPAGRYREDVRDARQDFDRDRARAYDSYQRSIRDAEEEYREARWRARTRRDHRRAYGEYSEDYRKAEERYRSRMSRAQERYHKELREAKERYYRNQDRRYRDRYDDWHRRDGRIWDDYRRRRHHDDWNRRRRNHTPLYGWDHGDYYWDRGTYSSWSHYDRNRNYDRGRVTYWRDGRGGSGYYRPHEDERYRNTGWNLSMNFNTPGNHGYVYYDPYTYNRGRRYNYTRWSDYHRRNTRLRWRNDEPRFRLRGGTDYWGDSFFYGSLSIPL